MVGTAALESLPLGWPAAMKIKSLTTEARRGGGNKEEKIKKHKTQNTKKHDLGPLGLIF